MIGVTYELPLCESVVVDGELTDRTELDCSIYFNGKSDNISISIGGISIDGIKRNILLRFDGDEITDLSKFFNMCDSLTAD